MLVGFAASGAFEGERLFLVELLEGQRAVTLEHCSGRLGELHRGGARCDLGCYQRTRVVLHLLTASMLRDDLHERFGSAVQSYLAVVLPEQQSHRRSAGRIDEKAEHPAVVRVERSEHIAADRER